MDFRAYLSRGTCSRSPSVRDCCAMCSGHPPSLNWMATYLSRLPESRLLGALFARRRILLLPLMIAPNARALNWQRWCSQSRTTLTSSGNVTMRFFTINLYQIEQLCRLNLTGTSPVSIFFLRSFKAASPFLLSSFSNARFDKNNVGCNLHALLLPTQSPCSPIFRLLRLLENL